MGSGITTLVAHTKVLKQLKSPIRSLKETGSVNSSQDLQLMATQSQVNEDRAMVTLKLILSTDGSKSALLKYLDSQNKGYILNWYLDIDEYKKVKKENLLFKSIEIRSRYSLYCNDDDTESSIWKSVDETLPNHTCADIMVNTHDLNNKLENARILTMSLLIQELGGFSKSSFYSEYNSAVGKNDGKSQSHHKLKKLDVNLEEELKDKYHDILIIDDSPMNSKRLAHILEWNGHRARQANHGRVGINIAVNQSFSAILIDTTMTTMEPIEVAKRIKAWYNGNVFLTERNEKIPPTLSAKSVYTSAVSNKSADPKSISYMSQKYTNDEFQNGLMMPTGNENFVNEAFANLSSKSFGNNNSTVTTTTCMIIALVKDSHNYKPSRYDIDFLIPLRTTSSSSSSKGIVISTLSLLTFFHEFYDIIQQFEKRLTGNHNNDGHDVEDRNPSTASSDDDSDNDRDSGNNDKMKKTKATEGANVKQIGTGTSSSAKATVRTKNNQMFDRVYKSNALASLS